MNFLQKLESLMQSHEIDNLHVLSEKCDIPYTTLKGFYDRGTEKIQRLTLKKLAKFFGCTTDYLIYDEIEEPLMAYPDICNTSNNSHVKWFNNVNEMTESLEEEFQKGILEQYNALFDKDDRLTNEQKKFFMDFLTEKHKEIDAKLDK